MCARAFIYILSRRWAHVRERMRTCMCARVHVASCRKCRARACAHKHSGNPASLRVMHAHRNAGTQTQMCACMHACMYARWYAYTCRLCARTDTSTRTSKTWHASTHSHTHRSNEPHARSRARAGPLTHAHVATPAGAGSADAWMARRMPALWLLADSAAAAAAAGAQVVTPQAANVGARALSWPRRAGGSGSGDAGRARCAAGAATGPALGATPRHERERHAAARIGDRDLLVESGVTRALATRRFAKQTSKWSAARRHLVGRRTEPGASSDGASTGMAQALRFFVGPPRSSTFLCCACVDQVGVRAIDGSHTLGSTALRTPALGRPGRHADLTAGRAGACCRARARLPAAPDRPPDNLLAGRPPSLPSSCGADADVVCGARARPHACRRRRGWCRCLANSPASRTRAAP